MTSFGAMPIPVGTKPKLRAARFARFLLAICYAVAISLGGGPGGHGMAAAQTLGTVIICSDEGPVAVRMDRDGGTADHSGDCSKCTSCLSYPAAALMPPGPVVGRSLTRRRAGKRLARAQGGTRTVVRFHATGPPVPNLPSGQISYTARQTAGEASPGLTIVNTAPFGTWQGSGRSAKEADR